MFFYEYPTLSYHLKAVFYFIWYFLLCFSEIPFTIDCTLKDSSYKSRITFPYATNAICKIYSCTSKGGNVLTYPEAYAFTYYLIEKYGFNNVLNCCINYNFDGVFGSNYNVVMDEFMKSIA